jgi:hypothetical protein
MLLPCSTISTEYHVITGNLPLTHSRLVFGPIMCYNGDYLRALFAVDSLHTRCFKLGMRQVLSFAATFPTESLSFFLISSLSGYA